MRLCYRELIQMTRLTLLATTIKLSTLDHIAYPIFVSVTNPFCTTYHHSEQYAASRHWGPVMDHSELVMHSGPPVKSGNQSKMNKDKDTCH
jgi:hypothetical protein